MDALSQSMRLRVPFVLHSTYDFLMLPSVWTPAFVKLSTRYSCNHFHLLTSRRKPLLGIATNGKDFFLVMMNT